MVEFCIRCFPNKLGGPAIVKFFLRQAGVCETQIVESFKRGHSTISLYLSSWANARKLKDYLSRLGLRSVMISFKILSDSDWKCQWKKNIRPFCLTKGVYVVPAWIEKYVVPVRCKKIFLDTAVTFGMGLHPTTKLLANFITFRKGNLQKFLDVGTGSGILALLARLSGGDTIIAIDSDKEAVHIAQRNFRLNHCAVESIVHLDFGQFQPKEQFSFIAANLCTEDLIRFKGKFTQALQPEGYLAVSGIHQDNYHSFRRRFREQSLRMLRISRQKKWHAVLFRKVNASPSLVSSKS